MALGTAGILGGAEIAGFTPQAFELAGKAASATGNAIFNHLINIEVNTANISGANLIGWHAYTWLTSSDTGGWILAYLLSGLPQGTVKSVNLDPGKEYWAEFISKLKQAIDQEKRRLK